MVRRPTAAVRGGADANYEKNSPLTFSAGLAGKYSKQIQAPVACDWFGPFGRWIVFIADPLLLIHGMQDDVVPFKTTMMLIEKLIDEGKSCFELATTAAATHNWSAQPAVGEYLYGKLLTHFDRHLLCVAVSKL